jgi:DNA-binding protein HU-beta
LNKQDLISDVASLTGISRADTAVVVETTLRRIGHTISNGEEVRLVGFGVFSTGHRKSSKGRDPRTGNVIEIASIAQPKFRAGKVLKALVSSDRTR